MPYKLYCRNCGELIEGRGYEPPHVKVAVTTGSLKGGYRSDDYDVCCMDCAAALTTTLANGGEVRETQADWYCDQCGAEIEGTRSRMLSYYEWNEAGERNFKDLSAYVCSTECGAAYLRDHTPQEVV